MNKASNKNHNISYIHPSPVKMKLLVQNCWIVQYQIPRQKTAGVRFYIFILFYSDGNFLFCQRCGIVSVNLMLMLDYCNFF
jgi:hypothetical protein